MPPLPSPIPEDEDKLVLDDSSDPFIEELEMEPAPIQSPPPPTSTSPTTPPFQYKRAIVSMTLWCVFSITLSVYNKKLFSTAGADFHFPILTTSIHQSIQILLSLISLRFMNLSAVIGGSNKLYTFPPALASALDMGLSNTSLLFVTLSFYTMIKSSSLGFVLFFSILFGLETLTWQLATIILIMIIGVSLMAAGEIKFSLIGFLFVLFGALSSGVRWALIKLFLNGRFNDNESDLEAQSKRDAIVKKPHPIQTILALSPYMAAILLIWGSVMEGIPSFCKSPYWSEYPLWKSITLILIPGFLAYGMTIFEYTLLDTTGPMTLAIVGVFKEISSIGASILIFGDKLTPINITGLVISLGTIGIYNYYKLS